MMPLWQFRSFSEESGDSVIEVWLRSEEKQDKKKTLRARLDAMLRRLQLMPVPWNRNYYKKLDGYEVGEIRLDVHNKEYRVFGFFGMGRFTMVAAGYHQTKKYYPPSIRETADRNKKIAEVRPERTRPYEP
jgi:hypothetical protein